MPVAREDTVFHRAFTQWKSHVRAAVFDGVEPAVAGENDDRLSVRRQYFHAFLLKLCDRRNFKSVVVHCTAPAL
jgi:hypothetical protein